MKRFAFLVVVLLFGCSGGLHAQRTLTSLPPVYRSDSTALDLLEASEHTPIVAVRHLGAICSHCVEQIVLINDYASEFRTRGARVVAFSMDDEDECASATRRYDIDTSVVTLCYDKRDACSMAIGSTIHEVDGSFTDLHTVLVLRNRQVVYEHYSTQPLMSLGAVFEALKQ